MKVHSFLDELDKEDQRLRRVDEGDFLCCLQNRQEVADDSPELLEVWGRGEPFQQWANLWLLDLQPCTELWEGID